MSVKFCMSTYLQFIMFNIHKPSLIHVGEVLYVNLSAVYHVTYQNCGSFVGQDLILLFKHFKPLTVRTLKTKYLNYHPVYSNFNQHLCRIHTKNSLDIKSKCCPKGTKCCPKETKCCPKGTKCCPKGTKCPIFIKKKVWLAFKLIMFNRRFKHGFYLKIDKFQMQFLKKAHLCIRRKTRKLSELSSFPD